MKKQGKKWMLVVLALLAVVTVTLPLVGCKNDTVAEQTGDGTGSGDGNQGTGGETEAGGGTGSGDPEQPVTYTVFFNANNGTGSIDSQTIVRGQTATKPADPTLENNVFGGWYSDAKFSKSYDFTTPVTGSFTLYAKWVKRIEVTAYNVSSVIAGLTGDGSYILVAIGNWSSVHLSAIRTALSSNKSAKVNLDLSKATGLTTIGDSAFRGCSGLTSISIPSSVEIIGDLAFEGCSGLTSINIPEGVTTIGTRAFGGCSSLNISVNGNKTKYSSVNGMLLDKEKTILIAYPSAKETVTNVPTSVTTIGNNAFYGCKSLTSISIPSSVTSIGGDAFYGCSGLEEVTMEANTPPELGSSAFSNTSTGLQILVPNVVNYTNEAAKEKGWEPYQEKIKLID